MAGTYHIIMGLRAQAKKFDYYPKWRLSAFGIKQSWVQTGLHYLPCNLGQVKLSGFYVSSKIMPTFQRC